MKKDLAESDGRSMHRRLERPFKFDGHRIRSELHSAQCQWPRRRIDDDRADRLCAAGAAFDTLRRCTLALHHGLGLQINLAKQVENRSLLAALNVFFQRVGDSGFLGAMAANTYGFMNQVVIKGEIGCHLRAFLHLSKCEFLRQVGVNTRTLLSKSIEPASPRPALTNDNSHSYVVEPHPPTLLEIVLSGFTGATEASSLSRLNQSSLKQVRR